MALPPPDAPGPADMLEFIMIWGARLQRWLTSDYETYFKFQENDLVELQKFRQFTLERTRYLANELWDNLVSFQEKRTRDRLTYIITTFAWLDKFTWEWSGQAKTLFVDYWEWLKIIIGEDQLELHELAVSLYPKLKYYADQRAQTFDAYVHDWIVKADQWFVRDMVRYIGFVDDHADRLNEIVDVRFPNVYTTFNDKFIDLYELLAGSYQRILWITNNNETTLFDVLDKDIPNLLPFIEGEVSKLQVQINEFTRLHNILSENYEAIYDFVIVKQEPRITDLIGYIKNYLVPITTDPSGWIFGWLQWILISRGAALMGWVFGV